MSKKSFLISSAGLKNIIFENSIQVNSLVPDEKTNFNDNDFHFIIGQNEIKINNILAEFIFPRVSHIHQSDPTFNYLDISDFTFSEESSATSNIGIELINNFKKICTGNSIDIDEPMSHQLRILSLFLENEEIYEKINELYPISLEKTSIDTLLQYLANCEKLSWFKDQKIYDFISAKIESIDENSLMKLPQPVLFSIVSNENIKFSNEDSSFNFINRIFDDENSAQEDKHLNKIAFYEQICIEKLSENAFVELIEGLEIDEITGDLWARIKNRILMPKSAANSEKSLKTPVSIEYNNNPKSRFNGIFTYLGGGNSENVISQGTVEITALSFSGELGPYNVLNYSDISKYFYSKDKNSWVCFDFKDRKVKPSSYSIQTMNWSIKGGYNLKNWVIEGSNNNSDWKILDQRINNLSLDYESAQNNFTIQNQLDESDFYRYLRIRQNGVNSAGDYEFRFSSIEFYGTII